LIDITKWIDEGRDSVSFGDQQVGAVAKAFVNELQHPHT
jgi:hypothetical protein